VFGAINNNAGTPLLRGVIREEEASGYVDLLGGAPSRARDIVSQRNGITDVVLILERTLQDTRLKPVLEDDAVGAINEGTSNHTKIFGALG
jgi:hypothetical protein